MVHKRSMKRINKATGDTREMHLDITTEDRCAQRASRWHSTNSIWNSNSSIPSTGGLLGHYSANSMRPNF